MRRAAVAVLAATIGLGVSVWPAASPADAATPTNPKVVVIAGPVGDHNAHYQADADAIARTARKYTSNVVLLKSPRAPWSRVKPALQGAAIVVYLGHGNGWPSIYAPYQPYTKDGFGLDPETGADGVAHVYVGEYYIAHEVKLAPNAIVLFHHLCYASGNTEPGLAVGSLTDSKQRPDNYASGFIEAGARTVIADVTHPHTAYIDWLFVKHLSLGQLFYAYPTYHGHPIVTPSIRQPGFVSVLDPTTSSGPWYRSIVYDPDHTTDEVTRTAYRPTDVAPAMLTAPGAAEATQDVPWYGDPSLGSDPSGTLPAGARLRLTTAEPPLADGTSVFGFTSLDDATTGFISRTGLAPRDSSAPVLWTLDRPSSPASADGSYPFRIGYRASESIDATIEIRDAGGAVVKTATLQGDWTRWTWDLVGDDGATVPNGVYDWSLRGTDGWGNAPALASGRVTIDGTDPLSTATVAGTLGQNGWYVGAPQVTIGASDTGSGVAVKRYAIGSGAVKSATAPITLGSSGTFALRYWAVDRAGNVEPSHTRTIRVDLVKPLTTATVTGPMGTNGWFTGPVSVALTTTDVHSGVATLDVSVDGGDPTPYTDAIPLSGEGVHTLTYHAVDKAGNVEPTRTTTVRIDTTAPTSTGATLSGTVGGAGWYTGPVTVTFAGGADALSGFSGYRWRLDGGPASVSTTGTAIVKTSGTHTLTWSAQDRAGNVEAAKALSFKVDVVAPATTATVGGGPGGDPGFYRGPVSVALAATDGDSGVAGITASVDGAPAAPVTAAIPIDAPGAHTVVHRATDVAGNVEPPRTMRIVIDRTAPTIGAVAAAPGPFSPNGDGTRDGGLIGHHLSEPGWVDGVITDDGGTTVRTFSVRATGPGSIAWDGRSDAGGVVADGSYSVTLTPRDRAGNAGKAVAVAVSVYASFVGGALAPGLFFPQDRDALSTRAVFTATLRSGASVRLQVLNAAGTVVRTMVRELPAGPFALAWDGRADAGAMQPQGRYTFRVTVSKLGLSETKRFAVVAQAFDIRPSVSTARRGRTLTVTVVTAESLHTLPGLVVRQPGIGPFAVTLQRIAPRTYRATFTVRSSHTGSMALDVSARDAGGHLQTTSVRLAIR